MSKITKFKQQIADLQSQLTGYAQTKKDLCGRAQDLNTSIFNKVDSVLIQERKVIDEIALEEFISNSQQPSFLSSEYWSKYRPIRSLNSDTLPDRLRVGYWKIDDDQTFCTPGYIPFFRDESTIVIKVNNKTKDVGQKFVNAIVTRIYSLIPHYSQFTLFDPETNGAAFPVQRDVVTRQHETDMYHTLETIISDAQRINAISSLTQDEYFSTRVESVTMNDKYEFICAANFPKGYDNRCIEKLINIGNAGYISGKYLILLWNCDEELPRDISMDSFKNKIEIDLAFYTDENRIEENGVKVDFVEEEGLSSSDWKQVNEIIKAYKPKDRKITWDEYIGIDDSSVWSGDSSECIETVIGDVGGKPLSIWLGKKDSNNCAHGMLAATTGAGKSNLYHALILGLATRYSPEELRMYLIDGKNGVEFEVYRKFPHAEVVSLKSSSELTVSILKELAKEVADRNEFFKTQGVNSFDEYRKNRAHKMPRILLLIDEYQVLFEDKEAAEASDNLRTLTAQARSAGIHLILGSQRFSVPNIQNRDAVFGNIQLRIAMKMTQDDRISLTEFGKEGKEFIRSCDLPGQIVINQNSGSDGSNQLGKVAFIEPDEKKKLINDIVSRAESQNIEQRLMNTIVFEGDSAPNLDENPELMLLASKKPMNSNDIQKIAKKNEKEGGFGKSEWNPSEYPIIGWVGQEFNVYGQASIVFRRRKMENLLVIGDRNASRYGMLLGLLASFAVNGSSNDCSFYVFDRSTKGTDWHPYLERYCNEVLIPAGFKTVFANKVKDIRENLEELVLILKERLVMDQDERMELKPIFVMLTEPEDVEDLNLVFDSNGFKQDSELGTLLADLYMNGSNTGIHMVISSSCVNALYNVLQKKQLGYFRHRISLQISEQESYDLLQSRIGSTLQSQGEVPTIAYYVDINGSAKMRFKPYSINDEGFEDQFNKIKNLTIAR